jgi:hypothetical protein
MNQQLVLLSLDLHSRCVAYQINPSFENGLVMFEAEKKMHHFIQKCRANKWEILPEQLWLEIWKFLTIGEAMVKFFYDY